MQEGRGDGVLGMRHYVSMQPDAVTEVLELDDGTLPHWRYEVVADLAMCLDNKFDEPAALSYVKEKYGVTDPSIGGPMVYVYRMLKVGESFSSETCAKHRPQALEMAMFHWLTSVRPMIAVTNDVQFVLTPTNEDQTYGQFLLWALELNLDLRANVAACFEPAEHFGTFQNMLKTVEHDRTKRAASKMAKA